MVSRDQVEAETLETFQEELPSVYYSDKPDDVFESYLRNAELMYRRNFKFPPRMFAGASLIEDFAFIGPAAVLAGDVRIGSGALVGAGAVILPSRTVGPRATVGAGAVVTDDVVAASTVVGNPARSRLPGPPASEAEDE